MTEPNFLFLFIGMIALLMGGPLVEAVLGEPALIVGQLALDGLLLSGIWTLAGSRIAFRLGIVLAVASVSTTALTYLRPTPYVLLASLVIAWAFCLLSMLLCMRHVFVRGRVTFNHLLGATCVYLLLGALWGLTYAVAHAVDPSAFRMGDGARALDLDDCMYFSFVTLTTTGYGDIVPVARLVRTLAYLEGAAGQLYVAILVATLVTRYVAPSADVSASGPSRPAPPAPR